MQLDHTTRQPDPDTTLLTDSTGDLRYCRPLACFYLGLNGACSNASCFRLKGEASRQQEGLALYQGGPQPPLLSRRQSLETQYLTHRIQVQFNSTSASLPLYSVISCSAVISFGDLRIIGSAPRLKRCVAGCRGNYPEHSNQSQSLFCPQG